MGIQTMGFHGSDQQSHSQQPLARQNSWYSLTPHEVEGNLGKQLGSMNLDELLQNVWIAEAKSHSTANAMNIDIKNASAAPTPLNLQGSLALVRSFSGRTVDDVWRDIKLGQKMRTFDQEMEEGQDQKREPTLGEPTLGETTLENFLIEAGLYVSDASLGPTLGLDRMLPTPQSFTQHMGLLSSPSIEAQSDAPERGRKRYACGDVIEKTLDRRLKRKIKNRESAARSRARKQIGCDLIFPLPNLLHYFFIIVVFNLMNSYHNFQAYHNELVSKVSRLEEENMKHKKEKELDKMLTCESSPEARYQLRRTSSF